MSCDKITDDALVDFVERSLSADAAAEIERHLELCFECTRRLWAVRRVVQEAKAISESPSEALDARVSASIDKLRDRARVMQTLRRVAACAVAAVAVVVIVWPKHVPAPAPPQAAELDVPPVMIDAVVVEPGPALNPLNESKDPPLPDMNGDGRVDTADAMLFIRNIEEYGFDGIDLNDDGKFDIADKMLLLRAGRGVRLVRDALPR